MDSIVVFTDPILETVIREEIAKPSGDIHQSDLEALTSVDTNRQGIVKLVGLEYCTNLQELDVSRTGITNISALSNLTNLRKLYLAVTDITDISALSNLTNLHWLTLDDNLISDISPLVKNIKLGDGDIVHLTDNPLSDTSVNDYIPQLKERGVDVEY